MQDINPGNIMYIAQYSLKKFKNNELNKRYKTIFSFSNRSKMSVKWIRRNYKEIIKGYLEDSDGKRYKIPQSYKETLKKSDKEKFKEAYRKYEDGIMERISNISADELIKKQKIKEEIRKIRASRNDKKRDF